MPKNIVFCADGTWNGPGEEDSDSAQAPASNVFKLFLTLAGLDDPATAQLAKEQERSLRDASGNVLQIAKYLHGVGNSGNLLVKLIGGTMGAGLITRIVRGYTFVSRNYADGDQIYLIGFSRGAYTARALAGLISAQGLLDPAELPLDDKNDAYRKGAAVWYQWRRATLQNSGNWTQHFEEFMLDLPGFLNNAPGPDKLRPAPIEAIAVWDTVGSLGIPDFDAHMVEVDLFQFADTKLSPNIAHGRHAISIDEERGNFPATFWDADPRALQGLFPGAHADVGGGYTTSNNESGLSDGALEWMRGELKGLGVEFLTLPVQTGAPAVITENPDARGTAHQPWAQPPWNFLPRQARTLPPGFFLARTVLDRINGGPVKSDPTQPALDYLPANLGAYLDGKASKPGTTVVPV